MRGTKVKMGNQGVVIIGHQKGRDTKEKVYRNFGMPKPEGYRKSQRLMKMAERFRVPIITFIDTPGANPGGGIRVIGISLGDLHVGGGVARVCLVLVHVYTTASGGVGVVGGWVVAVGGGSGGVAGSKC